MLYRPIRLTPDAISIDSTQINLFSCVIDGDTCDSYRLIIYNATTSVEVFNSGKVTISPIKYSGETIIHSLTAGVLTNGTNYTYVFKLYEGVTEVTSRITLFYANTTPVVTLTFTNPIVSQKISLQAMYTQAQGIGISEYTYIIKSNSIVISEYNRIGSQDTRFTFSGLIDGSVGTIEFKGITQRGQAFTTGEIAYSVDYQAPNINITPTTELLYDSKVDFKWGKPIQIGGEETGSYQYVNDFIVNSNKALHLDSGSILKYTINHGESYTLKYKLSLNSGFTGKISQQKNTTTNEVYEFGYSGGKFYWNNNGITASSLTIPLPTGYAYIFILPQKAYVKIGTQVYEIKV